MFDFLRYIGNIDSERVSLDLSSGRKPPSRVVVVVVVVFDVINIAVTLLRVG